MTPSPDALLRWLTRRDYAIAPAIGATCAMRPGEVRSRLAGLESRRFVASRPDTTTTTPMRRVYHVTGEGKRAARIGETGMQDRGFGHLPAASGQP